MDDIFTIGVITSVGIVSYYGYYYLRRRLSSHIVNKVKEKFDEMQDGEGVTFKPLERSSSALISFTHGGKQHKISVPYNRAKGRKMARKKVFLVREDDRVEITHKQGVPYLLSAEDMGGTSIVVEKDNNVVGEYKIDQIPNYLE